MPELLLKLFLAASLIKLSFVTENSISYILLAIKTNDSFPGGTSFRYYLI